MRKIERLLVVLSVCCSVLFASGLALAANDYLAEISASYSRYEDDDDYEGRLCGVTAKIHFTKVTTEGHPLAEADFLERVGSVEVFVGGGESESDTSESEGTDFSIVGNFMFPSLPVAFYGLLAKSSYERDYDPPFTAWNHDMERDSLGIGVGWFIQDGLEVELNYLKSETDYGSPFNETSDDDFFAVYAKFVNKLGGGRAFNLEGYAMLNRYDNQTDDGTNREIMVGGDYYFNPRLSLGGSLSRNIGDDEFSEGDEVTVDFNAFITPIFALGVETGRFEAANSVGDDAETLDFYVKVRF